MRSITFLFICLLAFSETANAASSLCRPDVKPASTDELAYKERGDRCEGLFAQKVSATGLRIAAFHEHPAVFDENSLALNILSPGMSSSKTLTATSLRPKQYYRMDTAYVGANFSLTLDLVRHPQINIDPPELAAVICKEGCDSSLPTLVPASFAQNTPFNPYIALVANLELFELEISITDDETGEVLFDKEMLGSRTWPAARPATFPLKPYLERRESVIFKVIATGRGNKIIDSISARLRTK